MMHGKRVISALWLTGIIFSVLGLVFTLLGVALFLTTALVETKMVGMVFTPTGLLFLILGILFLRINAGNTKRRRELIEQGRYVWGQILEFVPNRSVRINGRCPYFACVRYIDGAGRSHIFKSESLLIFPDPAMVGKNVKIFYRDDSFHHYVVDMEPVLTDFIEH